MIHDPHRMIDAPHRRAMRSLLVAIGIASRSIDTEGMKASIDTPEASLSGRARESLRH